MNEQQKKDALKYIEAQLENGYLDLGFNDKDELLIIEEAIKMRKTIDEFNNVGCTSFILSPKEIKEIMDKCKKRYKEDIRDECCNCIWFDNDTNERHCTINQDT